MLRSTRIPLPLFAFLLFLYPILTVYILLFFEALQVQPSVLYLLCVLRAFLIIFLFRHLYSRRFISFFIPRVFAHTPFAFRSIDVPVPAAWLHFTPPSLVELHTEMHLMINGFLFIGFDIFVHFRSFSLFFLLLLVVHNSCSIKCTTLL